MYIKQPPNNATIGVNETDHFFKFFFQQNIIIMENVTYSLLFEPKTKHYKLVVRGNNKYCPSVSPIKRSTTSRNFTHQTCYVPFLLMYTYVHLFIKCAWYNSSTLPPSLFGG